MASDAKITTVAVVGSGMAGLVTAHLLQRDPRRRYRVTVLEKKNKLSLNSESIVVSPPGESKVAWADVPMRAIAAGYYSNLIQMYDYLGIAYRQQDFLFTFARLPHKDPHMVHASNFHQIPPKPLGSGILHWLVEAVYVVLCYLWFTVCCFLVAPRGDSNLSNAETLREYLQRIWLPSYYSTNYLLPLMAGVCTCSHQELLGFPASDIVDYKRRTHRRQHYVVDGGVQTVQEKLSKGLDLKLDMCLTGVTTTPVGVQVQWLDTDGRQHYELFDKVVLAVSPDIVAAIFQPLHPALSDIPTTIVHTVAHTDNSTLPDLYGHPPAKLSLRTGKPSAGVVQNIHFRSSERDTESVHEQSASVIVTTNPLTPIKRASIIRTSKFTRVLRNPKSRRVLNDIFREGDAAPGAGAADGWRNGDGGVYLAGGWCWDGMVLLEGCIVSAMRVAFSLDVEVPWLAEQA